MLRSAPAASVPKPEAPTTAERVDLCKRHLVANVSARGERFGVAVTRRHLSGYLRGMPGAAALRQRLVTCDSLAGCLEILDGALTRPAPAVTAMTAMTSGAALEA